MDPEVLGKEQNCTPDAPMWGGGDDVFFVLILSPDMGVLQLSTSLFIANMLTPRVLVFR